MVYIVGAGPGDPELITVKGRALIERADVVIYAGSLVNQELLGWCREGCSVYDSSGMTLDEVVETVRGAEARGLAVVRLHTGDPSLYGAIREQIDALARYGIACEIVPGVSSFCAAAASLQTELTLPGVSQTVILTRIEGRTPVPEGEALEKLAAHRATMVLFLSAGHIARVADSLLSHYSPDTPAAVVYRASWPQERIIRSDLSSIARRAAEEGITSTALIVVGWCMGSEYELSCLYDRHFSHTFRKGLDA